MLEGFQLRVEQIISRALGPQGFALGGGHALQAHGVVERPSKDLDSYTASMDPDVFARAENTLSVALRDKHLDASVEITDTWFRQIVVSDPTTGDVVSVDLGYDYRQNPPVVIHGIGPVLDIEDVVLGKLRALSDRQAERDFVDVDAILADGRWSVYDLYEKLSQIRPEMDVQDFQKLLRSAGMGDPAEYSGLGLTPPGVAALNIRLNHHADQMVNEGNCDVVGSSSSGTGGSTACSECGRPLYAAESVARGYGPGCAKKR